MTVKAGVAGLVAFFWLAFNVGYAAEPEKLLAGFAKEQLIVQTQERCILISAYVAASRAQRSQGLMYIRSMPRHEGMLFLFPQTARISMWMKNTLIPLDMLFLAEDGTIIRIADQTVPLSENIIDSEAEASAVLELNGGAAKYFGIQPGHQISLIAQAGQG